VQNREKRGQTGFILVYVTVFCLILIGFLSLAVDMGHLYLVKTKLQNAVDAAALAGAARLPDTAGANAAASQYARANGLPLDGTDISCSDDDQQIIVSHTEAVETYFMRCFGFSTVPVTVRAAAVIRGPFRYAIFSGDSANDLNVDIGSCIINGSIHSNAGLNFAGGSFEVSGTAEAVKTIAVSGFGHIDAEQSGAGYVTMPDFSRQIAAAAAAGGHVYNGDTTLETDDVSYGKAIYVKGRLMIDAGVFVGTGAILADGDMFIKAGSIIAGDREVCFYSKNGNITIEGGAGEYQGIFYAPHGTVTVQTGAGIFYGSIIGRQIALKGGSIIVNHSDFQSVSPFPAAVRLVQ
jgi:formylmethanofuran dehydrogenase subunit C